MQKGKLVLSHGVFYIYPEQHLLVSENLNTIVLLTTSTSVAIETDKQWGGKVPNLLFSSERFFLVLFSFVFSSFYFCFWFFSSFQLFLY